MISSDDFVKPPLKLRHGWVITSHIWNGFDCLFIPQSQLDRVNQKGLTELLKVDRV